MRDKSTNRWATYAADNVDPLTSQPVSSGRVVSLDNQPLHTWDPAGPNSTLEIKLYRIVAL
jgi:hypothetical protein